MIRLVLSHAGMAASGLTMILSAAMVSGSPTARAQDDAPPSDGLIVVPGADGAPVGLRFGPALEHPVIVNLAPYEIVTPLGPAVQEGATRWLSVMTAANQVGWVSEQYVAPASAASTVASASPEPVIAEVLPPPPSSEPVVAEVLPPPPQPSPIPLTSSAPEASTVAAAPVSGRPLAIEAKLKYPEAKGRHQEITIWVTRDGVPVSGAIVTISTEDDEDEPLRVLEPTNADGRTRREFAIGREKGLIELVVSAVAPDGGEGQTTATYFRR
ncbi:MAG TPA: SH3 domain-containing protein [Chloroflexota bacterium]|nr:SH3 domain-containing protein [Chloroflexota bacterium]